jgi:YHS domain-containing protein/N-acetylneuraminic acid mutarotase
MLRPFLAAALLTTSAAVAADKPAPTYPPLPKGITSFGAVECDGFIYVYGGHAGKAHTYSNDTNLGTFHRLPTGGGTKWEELPDGARLQGLNLTTTGGKIYRVGGMEARNKAGEKSDLHSTAEVAVFDPKAKKWSAGVPMPAGRSSHDVVAVGSKLVVVGGWRMQGADKPEWSETALLLDTAVASPKWEAVAQPFKRRALTAAALNNKVYVIGGLTESGESVRKVNVLDVPSGKWSDGPEFPGTDKVGFSPAATVAGGKLILSTWDKSVYALNEKGTAWDKIGTMAEPRYVHRLVPGGMDAVVAIAGASPNGPLDTVEVVKLGGAKPAAPPADPSAQRFCPVMTSDEIDPNASATIDYKGVKIYLCCDACVGKFKRDPAAYLDPKIIPGLAGMELPKRDIEQMYCPVLKDRKVSSKDPSTTYKGVKIYFYSDLARQRFEKDPERYADPAILPQLPKK